EPQRLPARLVEAGAADVGALHAGGAVQDQDRVPASERVDAQQRAREPEHQQQDGEELEEEEQVPLQLLERGVGLDVLQEVRPEEDRANEHLPPLQLQQVEEDDDRREQQQP